MLAPITPAWEITNVMSARRMVVNSGRGSGDRVPATVLEGIEPQERALTVRQIHSQCAALRQLALAPRRHAPAEGEGGEDEAQPLASQGQLREPVTACGRTQGGPGSARPYPQAPGARMSVACPQRCLQRAQLRRQRSGPHAVRGDAHRPATGRVSPFAPARHSPGEVTPEACAAEATNARRGISTGNEAAAQARGRQHGMRVPWHRHVGAGGPKSSALIPQ